MRYFYTIISVRVDVAANRVVQTKKIGLVEIEKDLQRLHQIDANDMLKNFYNMIQIIQRFPDGKYLFRHEVKHNNQVLIYTETDDRYV